MDPAELAAAFEQTEKELLRLLYDDRPAPIFFLSGAPILE